jgi:hypothetical protein
MLSNAFLAALAAAGNQNFTYYVDSVNGNDANNGTSKASAFQSLSSVPLLTTGQSVGLACGSYWRGYLLDVNSSGNIIFGSYGTGAPPVMDGAVVVTGWTQNGTYSDIYQVSFTRDNTNPTTTELLGLWIDGIRPRFASSLADLEANGGWYADSRISLTTNVYVKTVPNSHTIEISKYDWAIGCYNAATPCYVNGPIEMKRYLAHYNALQMGPGQAQQFIVRDGTIHHTVTQASLTQDFILTELDIPSDPNLMVAYRDNPVGFTPVIKRGFAIFDQATLGGQNFTVHAISEHSGSTDIQSLDAEQCGFVGINGLAHLSASSGHLEGIYCHNVVSDGIFLGPGSTVTRLLMWDDQVSNYNGGVAAMTQIHAVVNASASITDCAVWGKKGAQMVMDTVGTVPLPMSHTVLSSDNGQAINVTSGSIAVNFCVIDTNDTNIQIWDGSDPGSYTGDYNVWAWWRNPSGFRPGAVKGQWKGSLIFHLNDWQAASGQDAHSVGLDSADQVSGNANAFWLGMALGTGGPEVGDFRINPNARVIGGDGTAYIGTFTDGTPITQAGPQTHWDWNARAIASGPPTHIPQLPITLSQMRQYIQTPKLWTF